MPPLTRSPALNTLQSLLAQLPAGTPMLDSVLKTAADLPFPARVAVPGNPDGIAALFDSWRMSDAPTLDILLGLAPDDSEACMMAAVLASVPSSLKYHNEHHSREVVFLAMLLSADMDPRARAEIFIAACIHDFAHDGRGNRRGATHTPMRLERRALEMAKPFLDAAGLDDISWKRISVMVLATDVSKDSTEAVSPAEWLRAAFAGKPVSGCPKELEELFFDKDLALQAGILEDADLGTSAGLPYDYASRMTALIADETGVLAPTPQTLIGFLDHICHGAFITRQALEVYGDNIAGLRDRADDENADTIYGWS